MEDLEADLERTVERIEREEAEAKAREELARNDLKRWKQEREEEAERALKELEERVKRKPEDQPVPQPSSRDVEVPAQSETEPETDTQDKQPSPIERFENLEIPVEDDERTASE